MIVPVEKLWDNFDNKYKAVNVASLEARRLKNMQTKGLSGTNVKPILEALRKIVAGKIKYKL